MWDELSGGIINLLNTLSTVDTSLAVFDYAKTKMATFPCITVTPSDNTAQFADTSRHQRSYVFAIRCYQERTNFGEAKSEQVMRKLVDSIITLFDQYQTLDIVNGFGRLNGRGFARPIPSTWKFVQAGQTDLRMAEILLECVVIQ